MGPAEGASRRDLILRLIYAHERRSAADRLDARALAGRLGWPAHEVAAWLRVCEQAGLLWLVVDGDADNPLVEALTPRGWQYARTRLRP